jgi:hypothetical protein
LGREARPEFIATEQLLGRKDFPSEHPGADYFSSTTFGRSERSECPFDTNRWQ